MLMARRDDNDDEMSRNNRNTTGQKISFNSFKNEITKNYYLQIHLNVCKKLLMPNPSLLKKTVVVLNKP